MPKATRKTRGDDDIPLHGTINEEEARQYSLNLDNIITKLGANVQDEVQNAMKEAIRKYKHEIATMVPGMETADPDAVWKAIKDKVGLSICPHTEQKEQMLECLLPDEDVPLAAQVLETMEDPEDMTKEDRILITELFESLEVAHSHTELASACSILSRLS